MVFLPTILGLIALTRVAGERAGILSLDESNSLLQGGVIRTEYVAKFDGTDALATVSDEEYEAELAEFQALFVNWKDVLYDMIRRNEACKEYHLNEEPHWGPCPELEEVPVDASLLQGGAKIKDRVEFDGTGTLRVVSEDEYAAALAQFQIDFPPWRDLVLQAIHEHQACSEHHINVEPHWGPCPTPAAAPAPASLLQIVEDVSKSDGTDALATVSDEEYEAALAEFQGLFDNWKDVLYDMIRRNEACKEYHLNEEPHWGPCPELEEAPVVASLLQGGAKIKAHRVKFDGTGTLRVVSEDEYAAALAQFQIDFPPWRDLLLQAIQEHEACSEHHINVEPHWGPCPSPAAAPQLLQADAHGR